MLQKAALHFHHMDMGLAVNMRSYGFAEASKLRAELLAAGFPESKVDGNGTLDRGDYFDEDGAAYFFDDAEPGAAVLEGSGEAPASEQAWVDPIDAQLANSPAALAAAVRAYLEVDPEGVLMVAADGLDAVVLELHENGQVVWVDPEGEVKTAHTPWTVMTPAPAEA
jgi:hypothetical protein